MTEADPFPIAPPFPSGLSDGSRQRRSIRWARGLYAGILLAGACGVVGWLTDFQYLVRPSPVAAPMSLVTAILLCLLSLALTIQSSPQTFARQWISATAGLIIFAAGAATFLSYLMRFALPFDAWLLDRRAALALHGQLNRMSPVSTVCFMLAGAAIVIRAHPPSRRQTAVLQVLWSAGLFLGLESLIGYFYSVTSLVAWGVHKPIAPQTAAALFLGYLGGFLAMPESGAMRLVLGEGSGGTLARRLLLFVFVLPIFLGALASAGLRAGLLNGATSIFFLTSSSALSLGGLLLYNAFTIDRSERGRQNAQASLGESERAYRMLFESAADPMFLVDSDSSIAEANTAAAQLLETTSHTLQGGRFSALTPGCADQAETGLRHAFQEGSASFESCLRSSSGIDVPVEINARTVEFRGRCAVLTIARDLRERKRSEKALAEKEELLRHAQKMEAVGRLAGGVAHDFNNLLTVIMGFAELILTRLSPKHAARSDVAEIKLCADRAAALIRQLLAFSRRERATPLPTRVSATLEKMEPLLCRLIGEKINLEVRARDRNAAILIDPHQLEQVILNLAVNARDAMPSGGTLRIHCAKRLLDLDGKDRIAWRHTPPPPPGAYLELTVQDGGPGIPPEVEPHIFEPFFTTKDEGVGTGLGLSTVYGIVTQNKGAIEVRTSGDTGTTMGVFFPLLPASGVKERLRRGAARREAEPLLTILLVEDDPSVRRYLAGGLRMAGHTVLDAGSANAALDIVDAHQGRIDAVVSDVVMPGVSGQDLARILARRVPDVRILLMSGYDPEENDAAAAGRDRFDFISKPLTVSALLRKLADVRPVGHAPAGGIP